MMTFLANLRRCEQGATATEMALVLLAFIILVFGMIEFAVAYWTLHTMLLALEEVGRFAMVNNSTITTNTAEQFVCNVLTGSTSSCTNPAPGSSCGATAGQYCVNAVQSSSSNTMTLTATFGFNFIGLTGSSIPLGSQVTVPLD